MPSRARSSPASLPTLALIVLPFFTWAAIALLAQAERYPAAAAEGSYLALLAAAVVAALAALEPHRGYGTVGTALIATTTVWAVPFVPTRGVVVAVVLVTALAYTTWRRLTLTAGASALWSIAVPVAIGSQLLFRSELLLHPGLDRQTLIPLLLWPLLGAAATVWLAVAGRPPALCAAGLVLALQGGWGPIVVSALAVPAAGLAWSRSTDLRSRVPAAGLGIAALLPAAMQSQRLALLLAGLAVGLAVANGRRGRLVLAVAVTALAALLFAAGAIGDAPDALVSSSWLPLLVPTLVGAKRHRRGPLLVLLLTSPFVLRYVPPDLALTGLVVAALMLLAPDAAATAVQGSWSAVLSSLAALLSAYPWLRSEPLRDALGLFGLAPTWPAAAIVLVAGGLLLLLWRWREQRRRRPVLLPIGLLLLAAVAVHLWPPPLFTTTFPHVRLDGERENWQRRIAVEEPVAGVVVHSYATNTSGLPAGHPLGWVAIHSADGKKHEWPVQIGVETDDWAAGRAELTTRRGFEGAPVWIGWVTPGRRHFGQRYRARFRLRRPVEARRIIVRRNPDLSSDAHLVLLQIELDRR